MHATFSVNICNLCDHLCLYLIKPSLLSILVCFVDPEKYFYFPLCCIPSDTVSSFINANRNR